MTSNLEADRILYTGAGLLFPCVWFTKPVAWWYNQTVCVCQAAVKDSMAAGKIRQRGAGSFGAD